jgi:hypothetical protein
MSVNTTLAGLSQTAASNGPDGSVDPPSTIDDSVRYALSFIASLRDGKGFTTPAVLASASTTDIGAQNSLGVEISGTTTITSFGTAYNGPRFLRFTGALTLTHNASNLILPGGANITTAAGDCAVVIPKTTAGTADGWQVLVYQKSDLSQKPTLGTTVAATSGTSIDFTGIPSWVKRITVSASGLSTNGTDQIMIRLGTAASGGTIETTGYLSGFTIISTSGVLTGNATTGFNVGNAGTAAALYNGSMTITLLNPATNTWAATGIFYESQQTEGHSMAGSKPLAAALDRIRITTPGGANTFDAGVVNILYEG